ncbi:MAG: hypothetical protein K2P58_01855 [Hyphomonadaceae bacterium]|nr:hypothetical protein [Hyphomonadaceae bacterium]
MNRERFQQLLEAYGADFSRWPEGERAAGEAFARWNTADVAASVAVARALDATLDSVKSEPLDLEALSAKILAAAPRAHPMFDRRAVYALAACAVFGVLIGFGAGMLAPAPAMDETYFVQALEAPWLGEEG